MALRQRKAKDPVLPLFSTNDSEESSKRGRPLMPYTPTPRKHAGEPRLLYKVYIPIIGFFVVAFGFAYLTIGGGINQKSHHREIRLHRHYHEHTAGRMKEEQRPIATVGSKYPVVKGVMPKPEITKTKPVKSTDTTINPVKRQSFAKIKLRCPDGADGILNDDYCDCADGSDESTTSACSHLTVQKSTFHCLDGTAIIYASRVGDGVKDCLDGSDEII
jgi:hypothetical protein